LLEPGKYYNLNLDLAVGLGRIGEKLPLNKRSLILLRTVIKILLAIPPVL